MTKNFKSSWRPISCPNYLCRWFLNNWLLPRGNPLAFTSIIQIPSASMTSKDKIGRQLGFNKKSPYEILIPFYSRALSNKQIGFTKIENIYSEHRLKASQITPIFSNLIHSGTPKGLCIKDSSYQELSKSALFPPHFTFLDKDLNFYSKFSKRNTKGTLCDSKHYFQNRQSAPSSYPSKSYKSNDLSLFYTIIGITYGHL